MPRQKQASVSAPKKISPAMQQTFDTVQQLASEAPAQTIVPFAQAAPKPTTVDDELTKREEIKNKSLEQDIRLKRYTLYALFIFLGFETLLVFLFAYFQGVKFMGFQLDQWSFNILVTATILQITYMVRIAVQSLFPTEPTSTTLSSPNVPT